MATPGLPPPEMIPSLLTLSDVMGTGWFAADAANVKQGMAEVERGEGIAIEEAEHRLRKKHGFSR